MNEDRDDQKWVDALGGNLTDKQAPSVVEREASMVRNVMLRQMQERNSYEPSQARLDMLMAEANHQGLLRKENASSGVLAFLNRVYEFLAMPAGVMASAALVLGLSITVGWQANEMNSSEELAVRGGASAERISLIVPSPKETAQGWQKDLLAAGIEHTVSFEQPSRILIRMKLTPDAIRLLKEGKRIQPPAGAWITLVIDAAKVAPQ